MEIYQEELVKAVTNHPDEYPWPVSDAPKVAEKMRLAIIRGTYNKDGYAFKGTCKRLRIPHTYRAINDYILQTEVI